MRSGLSLIGLVGAGAVAAVVAGSAEQTVELTGTVGLNGGPYAHQRLLPNIRWTGQWLRAAGCVTIAGHER